MTDVRKRGRRLPDLALLTSTIEGARLTEVEAAPAPSPDLSPREVRLDEVWLDRQPREIVPEEDLQRLIAEGRAQPSALLDLLRRVAEGDRYYADILEKLDGLSRSVASQGVLQPIEVARKEGRLVVRDGHRRCLASLLAGRETVPAVLVEEPTELEAVARSLIVNLQREDLTALEKGAALLRVARLVAERLARDAGADATSSVSLETLLGDDGAAEALDGSPDERHGKAPTSGSRTLAAAVRERVCAMVGLQRRSYYRLLALNRLSIEARAVGRYLTENQLRPIVGLAPDEQGEIARFAVRRGLSSKEIATLAGVARSGDRDAVSRVMARLAKEEGVRQRTAVSWEPLLHAVPRDLWRRCQALRSELEALPPSQRRARLDAMWDQDRLLRSLHEEFQSIMTAHGYRGPGDPLEVGDEE